MRKVFPIALIFIFGILFVPNFSYAQSGELNVNDIILKINPENPGVFQNVSFSVNSYLFNVHTSSFTWLVNGIVVKTGIGSNTFLTETKGLGVTTNITVKINIGGNIIVKNIILKPTEVDIFWESVSGYTPPFYKGRALPTEESQIRVVAIPINEVGMSSMNPSDFSYTWKRGEAVLQNLSGYNKNSLTYYGDYLNPAENISLSVTNTLGNYSAKKNVSIPLFDPEILIYENHPLRGILYEKEMGSSTIISSGEKTLIAEPYFMNAIGPTSSYLNYSWRVNGAKIQNPSKKNQLTVRSGGQAGSSLITLDIENITKLFEKVSKSLSITLAQ